MPSHIPIAIAVVDPPDIPVRTRRRVAQIPIENSGIHAIVRIAAEIGTDPHTKSLYDFK